MENKLRGVWDKLVRTGGKKSPGIDAAVDLVLDNSCPKIRSIRGYKKRLREPVAYALNHIASLIDAIPGPLDIMTEETLYEELVKPFFINREQLDDALAKESGLNAFLSGNPGESFFVLLTMSREVKTILGSRVQGDMVYRDVALKTVNFSDHKFNVPALTLEELVQSLEKGVLQGLAHWSLEKILAEKSRAEELNLLEKEVSTKLKILATKREQDVLKGQSTTGKPSYREAQKLLDDIERELSVVKARSKDMNYYLSDIIDLLDNAGELMTADKASMHFGQMGVLIDGAPDEDSNAVQVLNFRMGDNFRRSCVLLKCRRNILLKNG